jgi:hypothetical protein
MKEAGKAANRRATRMGQKGVLLPLLSSNPSRLSQKVKTAAGHGWGLLPKKATNRHVCLPIACCQDTPTPTTARQPQRLPCHGR